MAKPTDRSFQIVRGEIGRKLGSPEYSFCEMVTASAVSPWHIRRLTSRGLMLGGGADTLAFCGRKVSWDLEVQLSRERVDATYTCVDCAWQYRAERNERGA